MGFFTRIDLIGSSRGESDSVLYDNKHGCPYHLAIVLHSPFLGWNDFDNSCLHSVLIDLVDEFLEVSKLVHCLYSQRQPSLSLEGSDTHQLRQIDTLVVHPPKK